MTQDANNPLSSLASLGQKQHFEHVIEGIYGTFRTPAGEVAYLQTKAKVGGDGSTHGKLIKALVPAREALNISEMDFNQLLQRDLDDHRIATTLIEYVLNPPANSLPGFYPPILAILLPFDQNQQPALHFPSPIETFEVDPEFAGLRFRCITHANAYRSQFAVNSNNDEALPIPLAVLRWNPDLSKMVIMDGQHRAMSLLAIQRTVTNSWDLTTKGARYKPFYEHHVKTWMEKAKAEGKAIDLSKIELPVTICWFPEAQNSSVRPKPHLAARKLFVDVNNNAKPPSEARLVLLSDTQLDNIFARELLNRLRRDERWRATFPLFGVEYDNPDKSATSPRRWSVMTSLDILKDAVVRTVFGPPKLINDPTASLQGKPAHREMDSRMRAQLDVGSLFPKVFNDGERVLNRENLGNRVFPLNDTEKLSKLLNKFYETWGVGILTLLSEVEPYKAHLTALQERYNNWIPADNNSFLARDALFEGVGMLWTIEEGHNLWKSDQKIARESKIPEPSQPDISKAWEIIERQQKPIFQKRRAALYLDSDSDSAVADSERLFKGLITYAAQVGLMLAWASLHSKSAQTVNPGDLATAFAKAINATLSSGPVASRNRRRVLLKKSELQTFHALNGLPKLEPSFASQYRYFWLELALFESGRGYLQEVGVDLDAADKLLVDCCRVYIRLLIDDRTRVRHRDPDVRTLSPAEQKAKARQRATEEIVEEQAQARKFWFGIPLEEGREKVRTLLQGIPPKSTDDSISEQDADEEIPELEDLEDDESEEEDGI